MYPISNAVKALFESEQRQILRITGTDKNGVAINITDEDIVLNSFNIDRCSCNGEKLEVGTAIASEMTFKLDNFDGRYNSVVFEGTELFVEIGIADWTQDNPTVNWIPCGYFTPDEQPRSLSTITIHALDRMTRFDKIPPAAVPWTTKAGTNITTESGAVIEFLSNIKFPITVWNLVERVCLLCNVPLVPIPIIVNRGILIDSMPVLQQDVTLRNLIQWCAGIMCTNAWIDWNGELNFRWSYIVPSADYLSTTANRFSSDIYENDISFTGVSYTNTQGATIISGSAGYTLDLTGNYLAAGNISTIMSNIRTFINNFSYRPFSASVINAPYLWPMDRIQVRDKTNIMRSCLLTNVNFGINSTTELKSKGETVQTNSGTAPSGVTNKQGFLVEQVVDKTNRKINDATTQEAIFNSLTNNGEEQALILYNGKLYLNASYIRTGTLVADFIKGGTLTLGGVNNINGSLSVVDASGNVIGSWNKDGINITSGSFSTSVVNGSDQYDIELVNGSMLFKRNGTVFGSLDISTGAFDISGGSNGMDVYLNASSSGQNTSIVVYKNGTVELNCDDLTINGNRGRSGAFVIDGDTYNFENGILVENI